VISLPCGEWRVKGLAQIAASHHDAASMREGGSEVGRWFQLAALPWSRSKLIAHPPTQLPEQHESAPTAQEAQAPDTRPLLTRLLTEAWWPLQFLWWELVVPVGIFLAAFQPRWALARSLDLITDESVYIPEGVREYLMLRHGDLANPNWLVNKEAPPLAKLLMGIGSLWGAHVWPLDGWLLGGRLPGVLLSSAALVVAYWLARPIFGRFPATLGALALALSPWVAYFGAIAYLDSYMVAFATTAVLLSWHAARRPALLPLVGLLLGLGFSAKYTGAFASIPVILYLAYYYAVVERRFAPRAAQRERRGVPWQLWIIPPIVLTTIFITDPAIWISPISRLWNSMLFEFDHALNGHNVYWNGQVWAHVPPGEAVYILLAKMSLIILVPALLALPWAAWRVVRGFRAPTARDDRAALMLCWLGGLLPAFGLLTIVVGTHYMLPLAPAVTFTGAWALVRSCEWLAARLNDALATGFAGVVRRSPAHNGMVAEADGAVRAQSAQTTAITRRPATTRPMRGRRAEAIGAAVSAGLAALLASFGAAPVAEADAASAIPSVRETGRLPGGLRRALTAQIVGLVLFALVAVGLTLPPAHGLATVPQAEGYTSEWLSGENQSLQVAYPGYSDAVEWIVTHTRGRASVTLMGTDGALDVWIHYRQSQFPQRIRLAVGFACPVGPQSQPCPKNPVTMYVVYPMHLVQRQQIYPMPPDWKAYVVATISGGDTTYCYILKMRNS